MAAGIAGRIYHRLHEENYLDSELPVPVSESNPSVPVPSAASVAHDASDSSGSVR
jgi:hypothetical protein